MSWSERLFGIGGGDSDGAVRTGLEDAYGRLVVQVQWLGRDADAAPTAGAERELRVVAREDEALAAELEERLKTLGVGHPTVATESPPLGAPNHWARLVEAIDRHRQSRDLFLETAARIAEIAPEVAPLFERLSRAEGAHLNLLRNLVARADPQALD